MCNQFRMLIKDGAVQLQLAHSTKTKLIINQYKTVGGCRLSQVKQELVAAMTSGPLVVSDNSRSAINLVRNVGDRPESEIESRQRDAESIDIAEVSSLGANL